MPPRVALIIVNWNGKGDTLECLASLQEDGYPSKQIIVVDNGSTDDSVVAIKTAFPEITVLETGANLGFTGGNNVGICYALDHSADYIFLLNNDTTVSLDAITKLVETAEAHNEYGLLTPVIHFFDNPEEVWFAGSQINLARGSAIHDNSRIPSPDEAPFEIPWASGCAMLVRANLLRELNGFDDRYFLNWEDVDLSLRVRAVGSIIVIVPSARIFHKVSRSFVGSSGIGRYYHVRNNLLLVTMHSGRGCVYALCSIITWRLYEAFREIVRRRDDHGTILRVTLLAVSHHFRGRYGKLYSLHKAEP